MSVQSRRHVRQNRACSFGVNLKWREGDSLYLYGSFNKGDHSDVKAADLQNILEKH